MRKNIWALVITFIAGLVLGGALVNFLKPDAHTWMLVGVMLAGGLMGGSVNYFLSKSDDPADTNVTKSLFVGVGASLLVPLFLNMLSSNLLNATRNDPTAILVFLGFCLIASISSKAFITTISEKLLREVKEAKEEATEAKEAAQEARDETAKVKSDIVPLVGKETEPDVEADGGPSDFMLELARVTLDEHETTVLRALAYHRFSLRSVWGLSKETNYSRDSLNHILERLSELGLAGAKSGKDGKPRWFITEQGRNVLTAHAMASSARG